MRQPDTAGIDGNFRPAAVAMSGNPTNHELRDFQRGVEQ